MRCGNCQQLWGLIELRTGSHVQLEATVSGCHHANLNVLPIGENIVMTKRHDYRRQIAVDFYNKFFPSRLGEIEYINFDYSVRDVPIEKGNRLWGFKDPRVSPLKTTFFGIPGTPIDILGVHARGNLKTNPKMANRVLNEYEVLVRIPHALESVCADGLDAWSEHGVAHFVKGGGWQYKIPHPERYVRYTTPFPNRRV
jgi:hypothetical protein